MRERTTVWVEPHSTIAERISRYVLENKTYVRSVEANLEDGAEVTSEVGDSQEFLEYLTEILNKSDASELNGKRVLRVRDVDIHKEDVGEIEVVVEDV